VERSILGAVIKDGYLVRALAIDDKGSGGDRLYSSSLKRFHCVG